MTYEEKLEKIIEKFVEEREMSRKGYPTKVSFYHNTVMGIDLDDIVKILLKLQDDEKAVKIVDVYQELGPNNPFDEPETERYENAQAIFIELDVNFDTWYSKYLHDKNSQLENLSWINLLKVFDVCNDISEKLQISNGSSIIIPSFPYPYLGRFIELFPVDTVGTRKAYQQHRWEGALYLKQQGIAVTVEAKGDNIINYGGILVVVNEAKFARFHQNIKSIFEKRRLEQVSQDDNQSATPKSTNEQPPSSTNMPLWSDSFKWLSEMKYSFGQYGTIEFTSHDRLHIFKTLVDKQGSWATVKELTGNKDDKFVRTTIKQIEDRLPKEAKDVIKIVPTTDDDLPNKPNEGAYRIRYTPQPKPL